MKLYYTPGACSLSPHIVAGEAGVVLQLEKVDLRTHTVDGGGDFYAVNPKGYVPTLKLDDGHILTEGPAIVQYLADLKPDAGLIPASGFARYKVLEWLTFINGEIHKSFGPLFGKASDEVKAEAVSKVKKRFETVSAGLGGQDYLTGAHFTAADAYLYVVLRWAQAMKVAVPDNLERLRDRVAARPKVQAVLKEEGLA